MCSHQLPEKAKKMEKGRKSQHSLSPTAGTSKETPLRPKKKPAKHLSRPRTPSPEVYKSSDAASDDDDAGEEGLRTTVVHEDTEEPEVGSKGKLGSGGKSRRKW